MAITSYDNKLPPPPSTYNILKVGNEDESALCNLIFETESLKKDGDKSSCHIYYTFNDGNDRWCDYIELANKKELEEVAGKMDQIAFDSCWPVGCTYIQFPNCSDPNYLFISKMGLKCYWEMLNYNGAFFRAEGTGAANFNGGLQVESLPNITGFLRSIISRDSSTIAEGAFWRESAWQNGDEGTNKYMEYANVRMDASRCNGAYGRRAEVAPKNYTIRIYRRAS